MRLFLAGAAAGNLAPLFKDYAGRLADGVPPGEAHERSVTAFLRGGQGREVPSWEKLNVLESFFYCRKNDWLPILLPRCKHFLLDSGAFSFMQGTGGSCDWDRYANEYADYINQYDIKHYFELDIDNLVGIREVERLRALIERRTGRKSLPVWHVERGKDYFLDMVKEYDYVGLGSIAKVVPGKKKITPKYFPWFIQTAKEHGSKIHALGYTPNDLHGKPFFSVDSVSWLYGNMTGSAFVFDRRGGMMTSESRTGSRLKHREGALSNYCEWVNYMRYAEEAL